MKPSELLNPKLLFRKFKGRLSTDLFKFLYTGSAKNREILRGPFKGLKFATSSFGASAYYPKILGTYEKELFPAVDQIVEANYPSIIDIGSAEGYYVGGLARLMPEVKITAFEAQAIGREQLKETIRRNSIEEQVEIRGECHSNDLKELLADPTQTLIICDVEGAELEILNPDAVPGLKQTPILVEIHDFVDPSISKILRDRFQPTHRIEEIHQAERTRDEVPVFSKFSQFLNRYTYHHYLVGEWRPKENFWFWMTPKK